MMFLLLLVSMSRSSKGHLCSQSESKTDNLQKRGARNGLQPYYSSKRLQEYGSQLKVRRHVRRDRHILLTSSPSSPDPTQCHESQLRKKMKQCDSMGTLVVPFIKAIHNPTHPDDRKSRNKAQEKSKGHFLK